MKIFSAAKYVGFAVLVLAMGAGCSATPEKDEGSGANLQSMAAQAIADARKAVERARSVDALWPSTEGFLRDAEAAYDGEDYENGISLANRARTEADQAYNEVMLERAKALLEEARQYEHVMNADQKNTLAEGEAAIARFEGEHAYNLLSGLLAELRSAMLNYTVESGDSLWSISGQNDVYDNPYQWPLIYKSNQDQIKDADLIFPDQEFAVDRFPNADDVDAAVSHAKNRGAWSLGTTEQSDVDYLGQ